MRAIDADSVEEYLDDYIDPYEIGGVLLAISHMPTIEPEITKDGTLIVNVQDASLVGRVLVWSGVTKNGGGLYYLSDSSDKIIHCKNCRYHGSDDFCYEHGSFTRPVDFCSFGKENYNE